MKDVKPISKFLSLVLRHKPEKIGLTMDMNGWVSVDELLERMRKTGKAISRDTLNYVVENNDKKRFAFSEDGKQIRASQGHSIEVDLQYTPVQPLEYLYHGTVNKYMQSIRETGLQKMNRTHVHLSKDRETAITVGNRRGSAIILTINAGQMFKDGHEFYLSANGVWLCNGVPPQYINF
ncbi:MAG TPA: RNA 2'-phosphotransferase [Flavobacteriales bacterium]|nr:RNA 2'-phosphotransferase [Flavobacteriales bacterium]